LHRLALAIRSVTVTEWAPNPVLATLWFAKTRVGPSRRGNPARAAVRGLRNVQSDRVSMDGFSRTVSIDETNCGKTIRVRP